MIEWEEFTARGFSDLPVAGTMGVVVNGCEDVGIEVSDMHKFAVLLSVEITVLAAAGPGVVPEGRGREEVAEDDVTTATDAEAVVAGGSGRRDGAVAGLVDEDGAETSVAGEVGGCVEVGTGASVESRRGMVREKWVAVQNDYKKL